jgi:hypothetical protein
MGSFFAMHSVIHGSARLIVHGRFEEAKAPKNDGAQKLLWGKQLVGSEGRQFTQRRLMWGSARGSVAIRREAPQKAGQTCAEALAPGTRLSRVLPGMVVNVRRDPRLGEGRV